MDKLIAHRLSKNSHPLLIERMRQIYNTMIPWVATRPLTPIESQPQQDWWNQLVDHTKTTFHLYSPIETPWEICAYSVVTDRGDFCTPHFAIGGAWWGRGYGAEIIQHYLEVAAKPLYGSQLVSNAAIRHLNTKFGWHVLDTRDGVEYLHHPGVNPNIRQQEIYDEILRYHGVAS